MSGKKSTPATQTSTSTNDPWAPLVPHLTSLFTQGQTALNNTPRTAADIYAGPNQDQLTAADWMRSAAPGMGTGVDQLRTLGTDTISGRYLDPETNPWLRKSVDMALEQNTNNLNRNVLPGLADQAIMGGAYGGSGYGVAQGILAGEANTANTNAATQMYGANYQMERDRQMQGASLLDQANRLALQPAQVLGTVGDQQQQWDQRALDAATAAPWNGLDRYAALLGLGTGYGTSSSTGTQTAARQGGGFLQGAIGGASAGSAFGPWGAGIGGVLGGLGSLFG